MAPPVQEEDQEEVVAEEEEETREVTREAEDTSMPRVESSTQEEELPPTPNRTPTQKSLRHTW